MSRESDKSLPRSSIRSVDPIKDGTFTKEGSVRLQDATLEMEDFPPGSIIDLATLESELFLTDEERSERIASWISDVPGDPEGSLYSVELHPEPLTLGTRLRQQYVESLVTSFTKSMSIVSGARTAPRTTLTSGKRAGTSDVSGKPQGKYRKVRSNEASSTARKWVKSAFGTWEFRFNLSTPGFDSHILRLTPRGSPALESIALILFAQPCVKLEEQADDTGQSNEIPCLQVPARAELGPDAIAQLSECYSAEDVKDVLKKQGLGDPESERNISSHPYRPLHEFRAWMLQLENDAAREEFVSVLTQGVDEVRKTHCGPEMFEQSDGRASSKPQ